MGFQIDALLGAHLGRTKYKAKADLAYEEIRDAILNGALKPGDRLPMEELGMHLQVSRMPVREAIKRLENEGFVTVTPHKGAIVASAAVEELTEMLAVRVVLEGFAAGKAALLASPEDIDKLESLCTEMEGLTDGEEHDRRLRNNREFHETICAISGNRFLRKTIAGIFDSIQRYRIQVGTSRNVAEQHREIVQAIAARDTARAERTMRKHASRHIAGERQLSVGIEVSAGTPEGARREA